MKFTVSIIAISLAQAACIFAAPTPEEWWKSRPLATRRLRTPWSQRPRHSPTPVSTDIISSAAQSPLPSVVQIETISAPAVPTPTEEPTQPEYSSTTTQIVYYSPLPQPEPTPSAVETTTTTPDSSAPAPTPTSSSPGLVSGGKPAIDSINNYRSKAGLPLMKWDDTLAANALKTGNDAGGKSLVHELNPGSFGQVLVYGFDDADKCTKDTKSWTPFEIFFLSWLCERPDDAALGGVCQQIADIGHINSGGQTGHHDILASKSYSKIGCAFARDPSAAKCDSFPGVWACDVA
jgi:uncharacterized protein YkwD